MKWNSTTSMCIVATLVSAGCERQSESRDPTERAMQTQVVPIDETLRTGMPERDVVTALDVSHVSCELGGSPSSSSYYCRSNRLQGRIIHLQFNISNDSWRLREWRLLTAEEANIVENAQSKGTVDFRAVGADWLKRREEVISQVRAMR